MPPYQIAYPVRHYRPGRRTRVRLLEFHTAEGARTVESLGAFLNRLGTASYHGGGDDVKIAYFVNRKNEAWHSRGANPMADGYCFCGFASWSREEWFRHPVMLENGAWWLASCARERGIPLRWLSLQNTAGAVRNYDHPGGVIDHDDYTKALRDGTHWDCGPNFPKDWVINRAAEILRGQASLPKPSPAPRILRWNLEDIQMHIVTGPDEVRWVSYFFEPGTLSKITLGWGTEGSLHEAKWWVRRRAWNEPRGVEDIDIDRYAHGGTQPHHMSLAWNVIPQADCLEIAVTAPGQGLHIVGTPA